MRCNIGRGVVGAGAILAILAASGCGGSSAADKAKEQACDASADIEAQIDTLQGLPVAAASIDTARTALQKIQADLGEIADAAPKTTDEFKEKLTDANDAFRADAEDIIQSISSAASVADAGAALTTAGQTLASSYQAAFGDIGC